MRHVNKVVLIGRVSGEPEWRDLRNGDKVAIWRLVVKRDVVRDPSATIDTIQCATFDPRVQQVLHHCQDGDTLEVRGALRRRFWRLGNRIANSYEVNVRTAVALEESARREGAQDEPGPWLGAE